MPVHANVRLAGPGGAVILFGAVLSLTRSHLSPAFAAFLASAACLAIGTRSFESGAGPWWWAVAGLFWLLAWRSARERPPTGPALFGGALLVRAICWIAAPATSGDLNRYAWEAEVWLAGLNPYRFAPDAIELAQLAAQHAELHARVEHAAIPAVYPPAAELAFVLATLAARAAAATGLAGVELARPIALRLLALFGDLVVLFALDAQRKRDHASRSALIAWAWCPLVALEFAGAGHFDSLGIACAVLALTSTKSTRARAGWLALGGALKLIPLGFAPFLASGRARLRTAVLALAAFVVLFAPMAWSLVGDAASGSGLAIYARSWESTSVLYRAIERPLWPIAPTGGGAVDAKLIARGVVVVLWLALAAWLVRRKVDAPRAAFALTAAFLLLTPTFHPWYATWIAPWLVLLPPSPARRAFGWMLALAPLQYVLLAGWREHGQWSEPAWLWPLMFGPLIFLLAAGAWRARDA